MMVARGIAGGDIFFTFSTSPQSRVNLVYDRHIGHDHVGFARVIEQFMAGPVWIEDHYVKIGGSKTECRYYPRPR